MKNACIIAGKVWCNGSPQTVRGQALAGTDGGHEGEGGEGLGKQMHENAVKMSNRQATLCPCLDFDV